MIIPETLSKIKRPARILLEGAVFALILGLVFLGGRISALAGSVQEEAPEIIYPPLAATDVPRYEEKGGDRAPTSWVFAASKTGKTYYPKDCAALGRVKPENRVYFISEAEAKEAGLSRSSSCK